MFYVPTPETCAFHKLYMMDEMPFFHIFCAKVNHIYCFTFFYCKSGSVDFNCL